MIVTCTRSLAAAGLLAAGATASLGWTWTTPDVATAETYAICDRNFAPGNPDAPGVGARQAKRLITACQYGADYAHEAIYEPYRIQDSSAEFPISPPTELAEFRHDYNVGRLRCTSGYDDKGQLQQLMACLDGYDAFAAGILQRADYDVSHAPNLTFDDAYFQRRDYTNAYQDMTDDQAWAKVTEDRVFHPERYPAYRLDQVFQPVPPASNPSAYDAATMTSTTHSHSIYPWYLYNRYYGCSYGCGAPYVGRPSYRRGNVRPNDVAAGTPNRGYGPNAAARPFAPTSPWHPSNLVRHLRPSVEAGSRPAVRGTIQRGGLGRTGAGRSFGSVASKLGGSAGGRGGGGRGGGGRGGSSS